VEFACETKLDRTVGKAVDRAAHETNVRLRQQGEASLIRGKRTDPQVGIPA